MCRGEPQTRTHGLGSRLWFHVKPVFPLPLRGGVYRVRTCSSMNKSMWTKCLCCMCSRLVYKISCYCYGDVLLAPIPNFHKDRCKVSVYFGRHPNCLPKKNYFFFPLNKQNRAKKNIWHEAVRWAEWLLAVLMLVPYGKLGMTIRHENKISGDCTSNQPTAQLLVETFFRS